MARIDRTLREDLRREFGNRGVVVFTALANDKSLRLLTFVASQPDPTYAVDIADQYPDLAKTFRTNMIQLEEAGLVRKFDSHPDPSAWRRHRDFLALVRAGKRVKGALSQRPLKPPPDDPTSSFTVTLYETTELGQAIGEALTRRIVKSGVVRGG